jgi:hypothetical protein
MLGDQNAGEKEKEESVDSLMILDGKKGEWVKRGMKGGGVGGRELLDNERAMKITRHLGQVGVDVSENVKKEADGCCGGPKEDRAVRIPTGLAFETVRVKSRGASGWH